MENYYEDVQINKFQLDDEFVKQSDRMLYYSEKRAEAEREYEDLKTALAYQKEKINQIKAEVDIEYRTAKRIFEGKITETALENVVTLDKDVKKEVETYFELSKRVNEKQFELSVISGVVDAMRHKKTSLENLAVLYQNGYYSEPKDKMRDIQKNKIKERSNG